MPKKQQAESVLHDWVHSLTFQMQALLLTGVRGPDATSKDNPAKQIVRYLRGAVIKPAGDWNGENDNTFMWGDYDLFDTYMSYFWQDHDEYPHHFIMHLVHCAQVIGYYHPDDDARDSWRLFYLKACESFHMNTETKKQMDARLNDFGCGYKEDINPDEERFHQRLP